MKKKKEKAVTREGADKRDAGKKSTGKRLLLIFISSVLCFAAFPNIDLWPLAWIALVPLFFAISNGKIKHAFLLGWFFGAAAGSMIAHWIPNALSFGNAGPLVNYTFFILLSGGYIGFYYAIFALGACRVMQSDMSPYLKGLAIPCLWVVLELCRAKVLTGMPWGILGYSQYRCLRLIQISDITGVYGVSFLLVMVNYAIYHACRNWPDILTSDKKLIQGTSLKLMIPSIVVVGTCLVYGTARLSQFESAAPGTPGGPGSVAVIQSVVPQDIKWLTKNKNRQLSAYLRLSETSLKQGARLIIWPETAIQFQLQESVPAPLLDLLDRYAASAVIGGFRRISRFGRPVFYNSAFYLDETGVRGIYDKMHLVPVSEYSPIELSRTLEMRFAYNQLTPGKKPVIFTAPHGRFSPLICFEIIFPELVRAAVNSGADYLINISNDAWFGRTNGHLQHFSMGIFRAVECRRPLIRSANTGISGFIRSSGHTVERLDPFQEGSVRHRPEVSGVTSFYLKYGDAFAWACFLGLLLVLFPGVKVFKSQ